jgi:hypothetical protein
VTLIQAVEADRPASTLVGRGSARGPGAGRITVGVVVVVGLTELHPRSGGTLKNPSNVAVASHRVAIASQGAID